MKTLLLAFVTVAVFALLSPGAHAAYYLEIDGVKGETSAQSSAAQTSVVTSAESGTASSSGSGTSATPPRSTESSSRTESTAGTVQAESGDAGKKGNVEIQWKVEEGQKGASIEPDEIDVAASTHSESGEKGGTEDINIGVGELKGGVSVAAGDVNGLTEEEKETFLLRVREHVVVKSDQDLESFAKGVLLGDENVEELSSDEKSVEVRYRVPAKFLGLIDTTLPVDVVAEKAQGELGAGVKVKFPWYRFLFGVHDELDEATIENDVRTAVLADLDQDGAVDVVLAARLMSSISNVLKTKHDTVKNSINNVR